MNARNAALFSGFLVASAASALAKPPLQLAERGVRVEPLAIAPARIENGKFVFGAWQEYQPVQTRGAKGYYYIFDCFGGYVFDADGDRAYVNHENGGRGTQPGALRWPSESNNAWCGLGSSRWYFGSTYVNPMTVEDIETLGVDAAAGSPIDAIDVAWWWGGGECVIAFLPSEDPGLCDEGNPMDHAYYSGVAVNLGEWEPGGYYLANIDGVWTTNGVFVQMPGPKSSYLAALLNPDGSLNTLQGTQLMLWGTGDGHGEVFRAGSQKTDAWDDDAPFNGLFSSNECYFYDYACCPDPLGKTVGFLGLRCPADVNWDGFVNGDDYDDFESAFDVADRCADINGDGFVNGNDFDAFASWFDEGC